MERTLRMRSAQVSVERGRDEEKKGRGKRNRRQSGLGDIEKDTSVTGDAKVEREVGGRSAGGTQEKKKKSTNGYAKGRRGATGGEFTAY